LRIKNDRVEGVCYITLPLFCRREAQNERRLFVQSLLEKYPYVALWADSVNTPEYKWSFPAADELPGTLESLLEGSWALLFFAQDGRRLLQDLPPMRSTEAQKKLLESTGAHAMILSWEDDIEWTFITREIDHDSH